MNAGKRIMSLFPYLDDLLAAIRSMRDNSIEISDVHAPTITGEIDEELGLKRSPVRFFTLAGGILGIIIGFGLSVYTAIQWHFIVSGKPPVPRVPYVIVSFEFCILIAVLFNIGGLLLLSRLPKRKLPAHYSARLTDDCYGMLVSCPPDRYDEVTKLLQEAGAEEIHELD